MRAKALTTWVALAACILASLLGFSILTTDTASAQLAPSASNSHSTLSAPLANPAAASAAEQLRTQIAARALTWYGNTPYEYGDPKRTGPGAGYRQDCSGFVSYVWGLPGPGPVTSQFSQYAIRIPFTSLRLGDALNNEGIGEDGHMILFWQWSDLERHTRFWALEMSGHFTDDDGTNYNAVLNLYQTDGCNAAGTGCKLRRILNWNKKQLLDFTDGTYYYAQRSKDIPAYATVAQDLKLDANNPAVNQNLTASFVVRNDGGQPLQLQGLTAVAHGPGAKALGRDAPAVNFPALSQVVLQPGQSIRYAETRQFTAPGDYMLEPLYQADGWLPLLTTPRSPAEAPQENQVWVNVH